MMELRQTMKQHKKQQRKNKFVRSNIIQTDTGTPVSALTSGSMDNNDGNHQNRKRKAASPATAVETNHNRSSTSSTSSTTNQTDLIDIIRRRRIYDIRGILEQTEPIITTDRRSSTIPTYTLFVDDLPSWQHLIDNHGQSSMGPHFPGVSELWKCLERRWCLKVGQHLWLHRSFVAINANHMQHICEVPSDRSIHFYASNAAIEEAYQNAEATHAMMLFGKLLKALTGEIKEIQDFSYWSRGRILIDCSTGVEWVTKTTDQYVTVDIIGVHPTFHMLSADQAQWFAHHSRTALFKRCYFDELAAASLTQGLAQGSSILQELELEFDEAYPNVHVFRSLASMFQQQTPCSLVILRLHLKTQDHDGSWDGLFDALTQYRGHVQNVSIDVGKGCVELLTLTRWCEGLATSPTIRRIVAYYRSIVFTNEEIREAVHRFEMAIKQNENIEDMQLNTQTPDYSNSCTSRCYNIWPILESRRLRKRLMKAVTATQPPPGRDEDSLNMMTRWNLIAMAVCDTDAWSFPTVLYETISSHVDIFLDLWKHGRGQQHLD
mmetsp:Transcript_12343/g.35795  ORF Transcript_12343/g.35795 Transcript_12343/m.35795 type:complete len:548 (+) Transcript_12343:284-1927(+)